MKQLKQCIFALLFLPFSSLLALEGNIQYRGGSGVGYEQHYGKIQFYHAFENQTFQPFIDIRYLLIDDSKQGGNLGAGLGYQFAWLNRLSFYTYFDLTVSSTDHLFTQITPGVSYTHPIAFSGRNYGEVACYLNGYFPLKGVEKNVVPIQFSRFKENQALLKATDCYALTGTNLELGYLSETWNKYNFYIAGSGYHFKREEQHGFGGFGKFRITYCDLISGQILVSKDRLFGTNVSGTIGIRIPLGRKKGSGAKNNDSSIYKSRPIERFEPIVLKKVARQFTAKNPAGMPLNFIFVNNIRGNSGSFEDPFATLAEAQAASKPGDYIYLFPGDGTKRGYSDGFVMQEKQTFAGSGSSLTIATSRGPIVIPAQTRSYPVMTNTNEGTDRHGVTLAKDCTVSGIVVDGSSGSGFYHNLTQGASNIQLFNCHANNNTKSGFNINSDAEVLLAATLTGCSAKDNFEAGFDIRNDPSDPLTVASLTLSMADCSAASNLNDGFCFKNDSLGSFTLSLANCSATENTDNGFYIRNDSSGSLTVGLTDCSAHGGENGFEIDKNGYNLGGQITNCTAGDNFGNNFSILSDAIEPIEEIENSPNPVSRGL